MNTTKVIAFIVTLFIVFATELLLIMLMTRKLKKTTAESNFSYSYATWFAVLILYASIIFKTTFVLLRESYDILWKLNTGKILTELIKTGTLLTGISFVWMLFWYGITQVLLFIIMPGRSLSKEMEGNHIMYFIIRGALLICIQIVATPVLESILRNFMPSMQTPFYH